MLVSRGGYPLASRMKVVHIGLYVTGCTTCYQRRGHAKNRRIPRLTSPAARIFKAAERWIVFRVSETVGVLRRHGDRQPVELSS